MKIRLEGHGPLQNAPKARVPWEDVWVVYERPRRGLQHIHSEEARRGRWAPVLIGALDLAGDLGMMPDLIHKYADRPWVTSYHLDLAEQETVTRLLKRWQTVVSRDYKTVYCRERYITRRITERMVTRLLEQGLNTSELKRLRPFEFEWVPCETVVMPISIPAPGKKGKDAAQ